LRESPQPIRKAATSRSAMDCGSIGARGHALAHSIDGSVADDGVMSRELRYGVWT
jgi:hypothetical protein